MSKSDDSFFLEVQKTNLSCPTGDSAAQQHMSDGKIPVITCEGGCIRGEIARLAANIIVKNGPFKRACHGEIFTAPDSPMSQWAKKADKVVVIDGCFMNCHGRILKNIIGKDELLQFDALSMYGKYTDLMDLDDVPEAERKKTAAQVAAKILAELTTATNAS